MPEIQNLKIVNFQILEIITRIFRKNLEIFREIKGREMSENCDCFADLNSWQNNI